MNARMLVATSLFLLVSSTGVDASGQPEGMGPDSAGAGARIQGHWTLTIREENGAVASLHTFDNHFVGQRILAALLMGTLKSRGWAIHLLITPDEGPWGVTCVQSIDCAVQQASFRYPWGPPTLRVEGDNGIVLSGTVQPGADGTIIVVNSYLDVCTPDTCSVDVCTIDICAYGGNRVTTRAFFDHLPPPPDAIHVKARQRIDVTLRITAR